MKKSKIAVIVSLLLAVSVFGAACKSEETTKKKKSTKKTKVEDTDDEDETKKTKKTKKTEDTDDTEETDAPSETTEDTKETDAPTETTENTTPSESTEDSSEDTQTETTDPLQTSEVQSSYEVPTPDTSGYKVISSDEFTSIVESKEYAVTDVKGMSDEVIAKAFLLAYDPSYEVSLMYGQYQSEKEATDQFEAITGMTDDNDGDEYVSVVTDHAVIVFDKEHDEYTVVICIDDVLILGVTDTEIGNVNKMNDILAELGYPVA